VPERRISSQGCLRGSLPSGIDRVVGGEEAILPFLDRGGGRTSAHSGLLSGEGESYSPRGESVQGGPPGSTPFQNLGKNLGKASAEMVSGRL